MWTSWGQVNFQYLVVQSSCTFNYKTCKVSLVVVTCESIIERGIRRRKKKEKIAEEVEVLYSN
jgi:hypothetical protein